MDSQQTSRQNSPNQRNIASKVRDIRKVCEARLLKPLQVNPKVKLHLVKSSTASNLSSTKHSNDPKKEKEIDLKDVVDRIKEVIKISSVHDKQALVVKEAKCLKKFEKNLLKKKLDEKLYQHLVEVRRSTENPKRSQMKAVTQNEQMLLEDLNLEQSVSQPNLASVQPTPQQGKNLNSTKEKENEKIQPSFKRSEDEFLSKLLKQKPSDRLKMASRHSRDTAKFTGTPQDPYKKSNKKVLEIFRSLSPGSRNGMNKESALGSENVSIVDNTNRRSSAIYPNFVNSEVNKFPILNYNSGARIVLRSTNLQYMSTQRSDSVAHRRTMSNAYLPQGTPAPMTQREHFEKSYKNFMKNFKRKRASQDIGENFVDAHETVSTMINKNYNYTEPNEEPEQEKQKYLVNRYGYQDVLFSSMQNFSVIVPPQSANKKQRPRNFFQFKLYGAPNTERSNVNLQLQISSYFTFVCF